MDQNQKPKRGFAAMNPERAREIQKLGAAANHAKGTAHKYTSEEAKAAAAKSVANRKARKEAQNAA